MIYRLQTVTVQAPVVLQPAPVMSMEVALDSGGAWMLTDLWNSLDPDRLCKVFRHTRHFVGVEPVIRGMVLNRLFSPDTHSCVQR